LNFKVFSGILIAFLILGVISGVGTNLLGKVEAEGAHVADSHAANASSKENANSPLIGVETFPSNSNVAKGNVEEVGIAEHKITRFELEELKSRVGVYVEGRDYNQMIDGYGTGLRPPTDDEWARIAESAYVVDSVTYQSSPPSVDQSAKPWFPPIGNQGGEGSCTAWAVGYYVKTYQEAKEHAWNFSGATWEGGSSGYPTQSYQKKIISPDFIYHLINNGVDSGSYFSDAIQLVCFIGASSWEKMPYNSADHTTWPSEEAWTEAPLYRGNSSGYQYMNVSTSTGLANLKNWIASDHLAIIGVDANKYSSLTSADMWTLDNYVNPSVNHANTIVGYDDNIAFTENGQLRYGAFKIANSWGVGGWENVIDGFYWISYEAMKQRVGYCMFYYDLVGYKPELAATFRISHDKRNECEITVGLGNPSAPTIAKMFSQYVFGGSVPFCSNNILFDITEFKNYVPTIYNQLYFLKVYDGGSSTVGSISKFAVEYADSMDAPRQTVNGNYVYLNVTLPLLETTWTEERLVNLDQDSVDQKIAMATDSSGNMYVAYADYGSLNLTEIFVRKSSDGGATWPLLVGVLDYHDLGYPSIAIDPYKNEIYVAFEREWSSNDHDIFVLRFVNGTWSLSSVANIMGEDDRFPSITCEYQYGSGNWQYISYEYVYNNDDRDLMFAKSQDNGATWSIKKLHGDWPDGNVYSQTSITNAEGNVYIAYKWGADYNSVCEIRVERSIDYGSTWTQFSDVDGLPNDCQFPSIAATHGGDAVMVGFQYKWSASDVDIWYSYSANKGSTWTKGQTLFTSGLEDEKSLTLVVDGEGTQTQNVRGYIHAVCKVGRYAKYRATYYSQLTNWSTPKTISDRWIGKGLAITVRSVNDIYYSNAAWTDTRTKNIYSSSKGLLIIDQAFVSDGRCDVGNKQTVGFHAKWAHNGSAIIEGNIYINETGYVTNETGWTIFNVSYDSVGKRLWSVTSASCHGITAYETMVAPSIIWDRIKIIDGGVAAALSNVGSPQTIWFKAVYEYDGVTFDPSKGTLYINGSEMLWSPTRGRWEYNYTSEMPATLSFKISSVSDYIYNLTTINDVAGDKTTTWTGINIIFVQQSSTLMVINGTAKITVQAAWAHNNTPIANCLVELIGNFTAQQQYTNATGYACFSVTESEVGIFSYQTIGKEANGITKAIEYRSTEIRFGRMATVTTNLVRGYNIMSLPVLNESFTASSLLAQIGDSAQSVFMFNTTTQRYVSYDKSLVEFGIPQPDFPIKPNTGYFIYLSENANLTITGIENAFRRVIQIKPGYNLIGWTASIESNATSAFIESSNGTIDSVFMFNTTTQRYVSYDKNLVEFGVPQKDFEVLPGRGYFVFAKRDSVLILEGEA